MKLQSILSHGTVVAATFVLSACGSSPSTATDPNGNTVALDDWAQELVAEEGCDPRVAAALAPHEANYGQCSMPTFGDVCGPANMEAGIAIIDETFETKQPQANPWLIACSRGADTRATLIAACMFNGRLGGEQEDCACAADATVEQEGDSEMVSIMAHTEALDNTEAQRRFPGKANLGNSSNADQMASLRGRHYDRFAECKERS